MKITLRKANAIQLLINEQLATKVINGYATIDKYSDALATTTTAAAAFVHDVNKKIELIDVLYAIRQAVSEASATAGISVLLTRLAHIAKVELLYKNIVVADKFYPGDAAVLAQLEDIKKPAVSAYGNKDSFQVSVLTKEVIAQFQAHLLEFRKSKQQISDKLLELNIKTEILLTDTETATLKKYDII